MMSTCSWLTMIREVMFSLSVMRNPVFPHAQSFGPFWQVTAIQSKHTICIDSMPRNVHDVRRRCGPVVDDDSSSEDECLMQADDVDKSPVKETTPDLQVPEGPLPLLRRIAELNPRRQV